MSTKVLGIVGSYRKGGAVDTLVDKMLAGAASRGAETEKIYLVDAKIEFCTNCRACTQPPGPAPGPCPLEDEMNDLMAKCEAADGLVLGSPVNFFNITAISRRFLERLVCRVYWPWGQKTPQMRAKPTRRKAVLLVTSAMPGPLGRMFTSAMFAMKVMAKSLEAKPFQTLFVGLVAQQEKPELSQRCTQKAYRAGQRLVDAIG